MCLATDIFFGGAVIVQNLLFLPGCDGALSVSPCSYEKQRFFAKVPMKNSIFLADKSAVMVIFYVGGHENCCPPAVA